MESQFDVFYEIIDTETQERFVTADRFIAESHYENNCIVYERHRTITRHSTFSQTQTYAVLLWHNEDENENRNPKTEENLQ